MFNFDNITLKWLNTAITDHQGKIIFIFSFLWGINRFLILILEVCTQPVSQLPHLILSIFPQKMLLQEITFVHGEILPVLNRQAKIFFEFFILLMSKNNFHGYDGVLIITFFWAHFSPQFPPLAFLQILFKKSVNAYYTGSYYTGWRGIVIFAKYCPLLSHLYFAKEIMSFLNFREISKRSLSG